MRYVAAFVLLFVTWLLWSGHTEPLLLGLGAASCLVVVLLSARMAVIDDEGYPFHLTHRLLTYIPWVLWQVIKTNVDAARIILSPSLPIHSHLIHITVRQKTTLGRVIHANTITLTPGTVTLDVRGDTFLIHALTREAAHEDETGYLDDKVARLEGQE